MTDPDDAPGLDLTGVWHGQFTYPSGRRAVGFVATLSEADGWLVGATEEAGQAGDALGLVISATIQGRRTGREVTFLKTYDGAFEHYDSVRYEGRVSEDGTEIEGRWTIPGVWSGGFLMIRSGGGAIAEERRTAEQI